MCLTGVELFPHVFHGRFHRVGLNCVGAALLAFKKKTRLIIAQGESPRASPSVCLQTVLVGSGWTWQRLCTNPLNSQAMTYPAWYSLFPNPLTASSGTPWNEFGLEILSSSNLEQPGVLAACNTKEKKAAENIRGWISACSWTCWSCRWRRFAFPPEELFTSELAGVQRLKIRPWWTVNVLVIRVVTWESLAGSLSDSQAT